MAYRVGAFNFSKGVFSDELQARLDVEAYHAGMKRCVNGYILKQGGIAGRPGTRVVYETSSSQVRLIPFEVSQDQTYMMLLEQAVMKPMYLGGMVLEEELRITGITKGNPAIVTVANHSYVTNDEIYITGQSGMFEINGRVVRVIASTGTNTFTIDLNTTAYGTWTANTGGITRAGAPAPPPAPPPVPSPAPVPTPPPVAPSLGGGAYAGAGLGYGYAGFGYL